MINRRLTTSLTLLALALTAFAAPRDKNAIAAAASEALNGSGIQWKAPHKGQLKELKRNEAFTIMGYEDGGFAIVSNDDLIPAVLGYSDSKYNSESTNSNFQWYLQATERAVNYAVAKGTPLTTTRPDPTKYSTSVAALVRSHWGQEAPYNNLCPVGTSSGGYDWQGYGGTGRCVTGCVATAMAQIINYNRFPSHGTGTHSVRVKQSSGSYNTVTVNFAQSNYDYDNMLNSYSSSYTDAQGNAVARLMLDCGVACDMEYATDGSGAYSENACDGLKRNLGYPATTRVLQRSSYDEASWMNLIYNEVNERRAVYYTGVDTYNGGHAFVLDGYQSDGKVHINWGWEGSDDGYFDIALLNPESYQFSEYQDMIIGFRGPVGGLLGDTISVETPGTLADSLPDSIMPRLTELKVIGNINSNDLRTIRRFAGRDSIGSATNGILSTLDLREANIVEGGDGFLKSNVKSNAQVITTANNILPERAFFNCQGLSKLYLPETIDSIGDGALGGLLSLDSLYIPTGADKKYVVKDNVIYNRDSTELIALTPVYTGDFRIPDSVRTIHKYAMVGASKVTNVIIPASVEEIGDEAFSSMYGIQSFRVYHKTPVTLGTNVFDQVDKASVKLYVPAGTKNVYSRAAQWKDFAGTSGSRTYDNIIEFGTTIKARNALRKYGEQNPSFGWQIRGDYVTGEPVIECDATPESPVGRYALHVTPGTITSDAVEFEDGYLIVQKNKARLSADTIEVPAYTQDPVFTYTVDSLQNGETTVELTTEPTFTVVDAQGNTVSVLSEVGAEYRIIPSAAVSENYEFDYVPGILRVTEGTANGINTIIATDSNSSDNAPAYNLAGQRVSKGYRGIVIKNGKKFLSK